MKVEHIKNIKTELLSKDKYVLKKLTFNLRLRNNTWVTQSREVYNRGDGASILLYNTTKKTVLLVKQFRLPTYLNGNTTGYLLEVCAGMLDLDNPVDCIIRETNEEVGYQLKKVNKVYEAYSSPGVMTEIMHFFIAEYSEEMRVSAGGGLEEEHEDIEVIELPFKQALNMLESGEIKDMRTIVLLQHLALSNLIS